MSVNIILSYLRFETFFLGVLMLGLCSVSLSFTISQIYNSIFNHII